MPEHLVSSQSSYKESRATLEEPTQRGGEISILGSFQDLAKQSHNWPDPEAALFPLWQETGLDDVQRFLPTNISMSFLPPLLYRAQKANKMTQFWFWLARAGIKRLGCIISDQLPFYPVGGRWSSTGNRQIFLPLAGSSCWMITHKLCPSAVLPPLLQSPRSFKKSTFPFIFFFFSWLWLIHN